MTSGGATFPRGIRPKYSLGELQRLGLVEVADEDGRQVVRGVVGREVVVGLRLRDVRDVGGQPMTGQV